MAIQGLMIRACSIVGYGHKTPLCSRFLAPLYYQTAGIKSIEEELGIPQKPKRPLSAFLAFAETVRPKVMAQNPGLRLPDVIKKVGEEWKTCDPAIKKKINEECQKNLQEYRETLEKYYVSLTEKNLEALQAAKAKRKELKQAKAHKKKLKLLSKPKKPPTAYLLYIQSEHAKGTFKNMTPSEMFKLSSQLWKKASEDVVAEFQEKADSARRQYKIDLEAWEERMVSSGQIDLLYKPSRKSENDP